LSVDANDLKKMHNKAFHVGIRKSLT